MQYLAEFFETELDKEERRRLQFMKLGEKRIKSWDPILSPSKFYLCVVGILSSDGKADHAIAIADGWIFDASMERALPLEYHSLDICSSSDVRGSSSFVSITRGCLLKERSNL